MIEGLTPQASILQELKDRMNSSRDPIGGMGPSPYDRQMQGNEPSSLQPGREYFSPDNPPGYYGPSAVMASVPPEVEEQLFQTERRLVASGMRRFSPTELRIYAQKLMVQVGQQKAAEQMAAQNLPNAQDEGVVA